MNTQANKNQYKIPGGTTGQALVKLSNADYDFDWGDVNLNSSQPFSGIIQYNILDTVTPGSNTILELSDGTLFTYLWSTTNKYYISYDKTKVYKLESVATGGSNFTLTLEEYTGNGNGSIGTLANTYTRSSSTTIGSGVSFGINHNAFCVEGGKLFAPVTETGATEYYTEYTISGVSIGSPVLTNMQYGSVATEQFSYRYWVYDGTYHYIQNLGGAGAIAKRSYSSPSFTTVATASASRLLSTQAYIIVTPELLITNFFKISGGKVGNFCSPGTSSTIYPGIIYAEINTI